MPSQPSPNNQILFQPNNRWTMDSQSAYANGAAGSVAGVELWIAKNRKSTKQENFWGGMMSSNITSPIRFIKRPASKGNKVTLTIEGQLGGPGKKGGQRFAATTDFGTIPLRAQSIVLDLVKQATGVDPHAEEMIGRSIADGIPEQFGAWGAQYLQRMTDMTILHKSAATSRMWINGKALATLTSADTPSYGTIQSSAAYLSELGGRPFITGKDANGQPLWNLMFPLVEPHALALATDSDYVERVSSAGIRGASNPMFRGVIESVNGNTICQRRVTKPQGQLSAGTCWAPFAQLGVADAYDAGGAAVTFKGGGPLYNSGVTDTPWFETFPGNLFPWDEANSLALADSFWGSGPYYALIVNPPTAATDPNKVGMIKYTVTSAAANTLTVVEKLCNNGETAGINVDTIGDSVTAAGLFAGKFTRDYAVNARVIPCNAKGTPIGAFCGLGQDAIGFIRGNRWGELFRDNVEGGLSGNLAYTGWTFGQEPFVNNSGDTPGMVVIGCAVSYPHLNLPEVT